SVGVPISIEGRLWGVMVVAFTREELLPADTEARLAGFTELVATAVANAQARGEARGFAEEQAALRRVATLVARTAPPEEVFAAVTAEAGRLLTANLAVLTRYDADGDEILLGAWAATGASPVAVGTRVALGGRDASSLVFQTSRPARIESYADATGPAADIARELGVRASIGVPISVAGQLWGVMVVAFTHEEQLPADTEARLVGFTELAAAAVANAQAQAELAASRARIVAVDDAARRRIQRNLHDGAQQRLVTLSLGLEEARAAVPPGADELTQRLEGSMIEVAGVLEEVREVARGLHPAVQAAGNLPHLLQHASHLDHRALQPLGQLIGSWRHRRPRLLQAKAERDQPLLGAVVQIALDPAAGGIVDGHDPRPGGGQLGLGLRVGDRGGGQIGKAGQPRLGIRRQRL